MPTQAWACHTATLPTRKLEDSLIRLCESVTRSPKVDLWSCDEIVQELVNQGAVASESRWRHQSVREAAEEPTPGLLEYPQTKAVVVLGPLLRNVVRIYAVPVRRLPRIASLDDARPDPLGNAFGDIMGARSTARPPATRTQVAKCRHAYLRDLRLLSSRASAAT